MHQIQGTLTPRPPFDFNKSLQFLSHFRPAMGQQTTNDARTEQLADDVLTISDFRTRLHHYFKSAVSHDKYKATFSKLGIL